jgi:CRP-like cAMP-binding protein
VQRQYVETFTSLLVVVISREWQNGHASGAVASVDLGWLYTWRALSALWAVSVAEPVFRHPLMTDGPEVDEMIAAQPEHRDHHEGAGNAHRKHNPVASHDQPVYIGARQAGCTELNTAMTMSHSASSGRRSARAACDNGGIRMAKTRAPRVRRRTRQPGFDAKAFLESAGAARRMVTYPKGRTIFAQGEPSDTVLYIQKGSIKMSVLSRTGKEAVVAMLGPGDFFGEGALTGQSIRIGTATAITPTTVLIIDRATMLRLLREEPTFSERFISYMLVRNLRIEADLVDHLFNSSEKRLARALLLLARYGDQTGPERRIPKISQETLAEMVGTTRSRVNFFMNKFRDLGFIEYNGDLTIHTSLLSIVLHD